VSLPGWVTSRLLDAAFPAACAGCGAEGAPLCPACLPALAVRLGTPPGVPLGLPSTVPLPLLQLEWCAPFAGVVRSALHALKYAGERRLAAPLGAAMAARWAEAGAGGELLVPVPIHPERRRTRGYDQAVLLAESAAASLGLPAVTALARARATLPQFELGRERRAENVGGAFVLQPASHAGVAGHWVVLVDDVATTGATLVACAETLLAAGASGVSACTVAREA
jgi:ComF family protein